MVYFTPGPAQLYPTVKNYLQEAIENDVLSLSHRSDKFISFYQGIDQKLRTLFKLPNDYHIFFTASATEAMERLIENCVEKTSTHLVSGVFSSRFYEIACQLKRQSVVQSVEPGQAYDFLKIAKDTEAICLTHNETSSGMQFPLEDVYRLRDMYPEALLFMDIVSSAPCFEIDFTKVDAAFFSVQKGFGLPAGLCVLMVNERVLKKTEQLNQKGANIGSYHNFLNLSQMAQKWFTLETPNVLNIYLLNRVLDDFVKRGIPEVSKISGAKADLFYDLIDQISALIPLHQNPRFRSENTVVAKVDTPQKLIDYLATKGFAIGTGYGDLKTVAIRIANYPPTTLAQAEELVGYISAYFN